jgi:hypothetical protein
MKRWAKVTPKGVFLQRDNFAPPDESLEWMEYEDIPIPEHNKKTHLCDGPWFTVVDGMLQKTWNLRAKTQDELDEELVRAKESKKQKISFAHTRCIKGSTPVFLGFNMQFDIRDITMVRYAIEMAEQAEQTIIYLTDAENVNHYDVPLADARTVLMEMGMAYAEAHAKKQALRAQVEAAGTVEEVEAVKW